MLQANILDLVTCFLLFFSFTLVNKSRSLEDMVRLACHFHFFFRVDTMQAVTRLKVSNIY